MSAAFSPLLELFEPEEISADKFRYRGPETRWKRVYGGLVISQALAAANRTVTGDRRAHSLHAYFILPGDPAAPIECEVDRLRDGRSFSTRHCRVMQHGQIIFVLTASYHVQEPGLEHMTPMPEVPAPESLESFEQLQSRLRPGAARPHFEYFAGERPIEFRPVDPARFFPDGERQVNASQSVWFRTAHPLPDSPEIHSCALAYASDMTILDSTLVSHRKSVTDGTLQPASLDHAIWYHRDFRADDWLLFVQESPNASEARGLAIGRIYSPGGTLVATVAQEGLIRPRRS